MRVLQVFILAASMAAQSMGSAVPPPYPPSPPLPPPGPPQYPGYPPGPQPPYPPPGQPDMPIPPSNIDFGCVRTAQTLLTLVPVCAEKCVARGLAIDGCAPDDHICHCKNSARSAQVIGPCAAGPDASPFGACGAVDLKALEDIANAYCGFWGEVAARAEREAFQKCREGCGGYCEKNKKEYWSTGRDKD